LGVGGFVDEEDELALVVAVLGGDVDTRVGQPLQSAPS
jgi:hypothetical protein